LTFTPTRKPISLAKVTMGESGEPNWPAAMALTSELILKVSGA
jgi:hypothetical protein